MEAGAAAVRHAAGADAHELPDDRPGLVGGVLPPEAQHAEPGEDRVGEHREQAAEVVGVHGLGADAAAGELPGLADDLLHGPSADL